MAQDKKGPVSQLLEQFDAKAKSCKDLQEEYLRAVADFDNLRKRTQRDIEVSRRVALEALVMDLLPVLDSFERAVQSSEAGVSAEGMKKGMELIHRQLREALCRHGVEQYSCAGAEFDPRRAEAISFVHTDECKPGIVVSEVAKGYAAGERVLRPAKVVVAKEPQGGQSPESRVRNPESGNRKPETANHRPETGNQDSEVAEGEESRISESEAGKSGSESNG